MFNKGFPKIMPFMRRCGKIFVELDKTQMTVGRINIAFWITKATYIFTRELEGTRRRGRPKKGWKEEVERDLQVLGVRRWRGLVADRKKWKNIIRQARAHSGL